MRRSSFSVSVVALATLLLGAASPVVAGHVAVDPATLSPQPTPGASCWSTGTAVRCEGTFDFSYANEPAFELACGVVYATSQDIRTSIRWYVEGLLVRRAVHQTAIGFWTLSPTGAGPAVSVVAHTGWGETYTIPGDLSSAVGSQQGTDMLVRAPNGGVIAHISGQTPREEGFTGRFVVPDDGPAAAALCAALTG